MSASIKLATVFAVLIGAALAESAQADSRMLQGHRLILTVDRSENTFVTTDAGMSGAARLSLDGSVSCLSVTGGDEVVVDASGCPEEAGSLRIEVPANMPVTIGMSGSGAMTIGDLDAPLTVNVMGDGDLKAGRVAALTLGIHGGGNAGFGIVSGPVTVDMLGSGDARIGSVQGPLTLRQKSSGDIAIGAIQSPAVVIDSAGSGDMLLGAGAIGSLVARLSGSGDLAIAATTRDADVTANGGADVKLGRVTGTLKRQAGDSSNIVVVGSDLVNSLVGKAARSVGDADPSDHNVTVTLDSGHSGLHIFTFVVVAVLLYLSWKAVKRAGGFRAAGGRLRASVPQGAPTDPGVVAFAEAMARLDQRLGRVETYVTSREFDLQQKFRDLNKT